jgi:hypothetical protein
MIEKFDITLNIDGSDPVTAEARRTLVDVIPTTAGCHHGRRARS